MLELVAYMKCWKGNTVTSAINVFVRGVSAGLINSTGAGKRLIVVHIGNKKDFVESGLLVLRMQRSTNSGFRRCFFFT